MPSTPVWSGSLLLATREQASRGERVKAVHPRLSASVMAIVCHFSEGQQKNKKKRKYMEDDSGGRSPLVLADSCAADEKQKKNT